MEAEASFFFFGEDAGILGSKILLQNVPVSMERSTFLEDFVDETSRL